MQQRNTIPKVEDEDVEIKQEPEVGEGDEDDNVAPFDGSGVPGADDDDDSGRGRPGTWRETERAEQAPVSRASPPPSIETRNRYPPPGSAEVLDYSDTFSPPTTARDDDQTQRSKSPERSPPPRLSASRSPEGDMSPGSRVSPAPTSPRSLSRVRSRSPTRSVSPPETTTRHRRRSSSSASPLRRTSKRPRSRSRSLSPCRSRSRSPKSTRRYDINPYSASASRDMSSNIMSEALTILARHPPDPHGSLTHRDQLRSAAARIATARSGGKLLWEDLQKLVHVDGLLRTLIHEDYDSGRNSTSLSPRVSVGARSPSPTFTSSRSPVSPRAGSPPSRRRPSTGTRA